MSELDDLRAETALLRETLAERDGRLEAYTRRIQELETRPDVAPVLALALEAARAIRLHVSRTSPTCTPENCWSLRLVRDIEALS